MATCIYQIFLKVHAEEKSFLYAWIETQTTNQQQFNHGRWPEANVGQQY